MNFLFCLTTLLIVALGNCATIKNYTSVTTARDVAKLKCNERDVFDETVIDEFTTALQDTLPCFARAKRKVVPHPLTDFDEGCNVISNSGYYDCLENLAEKAKICLGPDEDYLPDMILNSYNKTRRSLCDPEEKIKIDPIAVRVNNLRNSSHVRVDQAMTECWLSPKLYLNKLQTVNFILKQEYLCRDIQVVNDCVVENLYEKSGGEDYSDIINIFLGNYLDWCRDHE